MPESPDAVPALIRRRAPRRLVCESGALVSRGFAELRPKRIDVPKAVAALVRQLRPRGPTVATRVLLPQLAPGDAETALGLLPDFPGLDLGADIFPAWLDGIERLDAPLITAALGERAAPDDIAHARLARSLVAHSRAPERHLARSLAERARDALADRSKDVRAPLYAEPVVVEERPGKAVVLALEEPTLKQQSKRWLASTAKDDARMPLEPEAGFGVGGALLTPAQYGGEPNPRARMLTVASFDARFPAGGLDLSAPERLRLAIDTWLAGAGAPAMSSFKQLYLAVPWLAVAAAFAEAILPAMQPRAGLAAPDLTLGWHPTLTGIEVIAVSPLPALFVHTGRFPVVHVVAAWSDR